MFVFRLGSMVVLTTPSNPLESGLATGTGRSDSSVRARFFGNHCQVITISAHHDFLDNIRDPTVWERTKEGAKSLGGASWDVLIGLAKAYVKAEAKKRLGIEL
jgi:hypothetical protein